MGRHIFITGGTGHMGSRLIPLLSARGHEVVALVRPGSEHKLPSAFTPVLKATLLSNLLAWRIPALRKPRSS